MLKEMLNKLKDTEGEDIYNDTESPLALGQNKEIIKFANALA